MDLNDEHWAIILPVTTDPRRLADGKKVDLGKFS